MLNKQTVISFGISILIKIAISTKIDPVSFKFNINYICNFNSYY